LKLGRSPFESPQPKNKNARNINLLRNIPFFQSLSDQDFSTFSIFSWSGTMPGTRQSFSRKTPQLHVYPPFREGKGNTFRTGRQGAHRCHSSERRFFWWNGPLDGKISCTVVALEDTLIAIISGKDFEKYLLKNDKILRQTISILCTRLREAWMMIKVLSLPNAEDRVRAVIFDSQRFLWISGRARHHSQFQAHAPEHCWLFIRIRETVTRLLNRLARDGEIEVLENKDIVWSRPLHKNLLYCDFQHFGPALF